jgi:hypothetical protein
MCGPTLPVALATAPGLLCRAPLACGYSGFSAAMNVLKLCHAGLCEAIFGPCPTPSHQRPQIGPELFLILSYGVLLVVTVGHGQLHTYMSTSADRCPEKIWSIPIQNSQTRLTLPRAGRGAPIARLKRSNFESPPEGFAIVGRPKTCLHFSRVMVEPMNHVRSKTDDRTVCTSVRVCEFKGKSKNPCLAFLCPVPLKEYVYIATSLKRNSLNIFHVHFLYHE